MTLQEEADIKLAEIRAKKLREAGKAGGNENQRNRLAETGLASNQFAEYNQGGYQQLTGEAAAQRDYLRRIAGGQESIAGEQLRQGLQQNIAGQQSMAASARPGGQAMAARQAMMNAGRAATGMSGQAAIAGMQERKNAQEALNQMIMQQRQQDLQGALGSRQTAISGYGGITPVKTKLEQLLPLINAGVGAAGAL